MNLSTHPMNPNLSVFLNLSRWVAAWLVLTGHVRHIVLVNLGDVHQATLIDKGLYFFTGFGHEAVVIFFVISGFLVGGSTLERWGRQGPDLTLYFAARISRLYTVLVPALLVGALMDWIGLHGFNASQLYTNSAQYHTISLGSDISAALDGRTLLGNLFMLQGLWVGNFGSNNPLWSLAYEWWYYCIFALFGLAWTGTGRGRLVWAAMGVLLAALLPAPITLWGVIWLLGLFTHRWVASRVWRPHPAIGIGLLVMALTASRLSHNTEQADSMAASFLRDLMLGIGFSVALASVSRLRSDSPFGRASRFSRFHARMADFSYSTYLCHFPAMILIIAIAYQEWGIPFQQQPDAQGVACLIGLSAVLLAYCLVFARLTERHTTAVQKRLLAMRAGPAPTVERQLS